MPFAPFDRTRAVAVTRLSQVAAMVIVGAGGLAAAMLGPKSGQTPPEALEVPVLDPLTQPGPATAMTPQEVKGGLLSGRFGAIGNAPKVPVPPPVAPPDEAPPVEIAETPATGIEILYLGPAALGGARFALVSEDGSQRIVGLRDPLGEGDVKSITPQELVIDENGTDRVIERSPRGSEVVTKAGKNTAPGGMKVAAIRRTPPARRPATPYPVGASGPNKVDPGMAAAERYRMVVDKVRASGQFGSDEAVIEKAARQMMEADPGDHMEKDPS